MRKLKPATQRDVEAAARMTAYLRLARACADSIGAEQTLKRIRLAITSAGGAVRHVKSRRNTST